MKQPRQESKTCLLEGIRGDGHCFYCESRIGDTDYGHVEHYRPKSLFPNLCFEWSNLHWSCAKCNTLKGQHWNGNTLIVDPCDDSDDTRDHIIYKLFRLKASTPNGAETISVFGLNDHRRRKELVDARMKVFLELMETIGEINRNDLGEHEKQEFIELLERISEESAYRGMIDYQINIYLK